MSQFEVGIQHERTVEVTPALSAIELGSGDVPVLATPAVLALAEGVCAELLGTQLSDDETSVGVHADVRHDAATMIGRRVTVAARPIKRDGRKVFFEVELREGDTVVARVTHERVIVDRQRFLERIGADDR